MQGASLSANAVAAGEGAIYLLNCLLAVQTLLQRYVHVYIIYRYI